MPKVILSDSRCEVYRDHGPKIYSESLLLHQIKTALIDQGFDVIKKRMWKDGHLFGSDSTQYIRTRSKKSGFMIYDADYAIRFNYEDYNKEGKAVFSVEQY